MRQQPRNHRRPWTDEARGRLLAKWRKGRTPAQIGHDMGRTVQAIREELRLLGIDPETSTAETLQGVVSPKPAPYQEGQTSAHESDCPYGVSTSEERVNRGWWLAGFHDRRS